MGREIKFRAWIQADPYDESDSPKMEMCYDLAFEDYEPVNDLLGSVEHLMQYTGLKDQHGVEIYEGDIILVIDAVSREQGVHEVKWVGIGWTRQILFTQVEVIGNIYEHGHLLEANQ